MKSQGFYVYRNKRLLVWGTWFRMMRQGELSKLARIQVDIPSALDNLWTLDIKKSMAVPPEIVRNNLESVIARMAERSKQTWVFRGKKETSDSVVHLWQRFKGTQGGFFYGINRDHPLVEIFSDAPPQIKRNVEALLKAIENGIPLNQLYIDLTSEKPLENGTEVTANEVESMLKLLIDQMPSVAAKKALLDRLSVSDPFVNYPEIIERYQKEGALCMAVTNEEQLEGMIFSNINTQFKEVPPSEAEFDRIADMLRQSLASFCPVTDDEFEDLKRRLKANIVVVMEIGVVIKDDKQPHQSWLPSRRSELDFFFWNRYKKYLEEIKHWNPRVTGNLGRVSDEIVDLLGDPKSENDFQRRGLVLGDVQSGKTANYTAICNKAADTGYRVIIVLAGMMENLRQQTQERLDAEFSGRKSEYFLDPTKKEIRNEPVGVGKYGTNKRIASFTSVVKDFDINVLKSNDLSLLSVSDPVVFVVKKNKSILNNLIRWLRNNNIVTGQKIDLPMLLIDDEADNASVNTKKGRRRPDGNQRSCSETFGVVSASVIFRYNRDTICEYFHQS